MSWRCFARADGGLRTAQVAAELGMLGDRPGTEALRMRLAGEGWLTRHQPTAVFTLADEVGSRQ
ncbi:hypothetical protein [Nocardia sp. Root136]|uniref:hypothetical protein n=1 Tax=Nocardia sp. Root136 TaxID=1736458 RepID=UPI0012E7FC8C|nr:hypothetical protein [Nocardia sp. Root136]